MTEEEAKTRWCPFARADVEGRIINRTSLGYGDDEAWRCLGSGCMAWRWDSVAGADKLYTQGHCGLAGKP